MYEQRNESLESERSARPRAGTTHGIGTSAQARRRPDLRGLAAVVVLCTLGSLFMGGAAAAVPALPHAAATSTASGWAMFHGDPALDGEATSPAPVHARIAWQQIIPTLANPFGNDPPYQSSPVVSGGTVYVVVDNAIYALNASTGSGLQYWSLPGGPGSGPGVATPLLASSGLLVESQDGGPNDVFVLDPSTSSSATCPLAGNPISGSASPVPAGLMVADTAGQIWRITYGTLLGCPTAPWVAPGGAAYFSTGALAYPGGVPTVVYADQGTRALDAFQGVGSSTGTSAAGFPATLLGLRLDASASVTNVTVAGHVLSLAFVGDDAGGAGTSHLFAVNLSSGLILGQLNLPLWKGQGVGVTDTPALVPLPGTSSVRVFFGSRNGNLTSSVFTVDPSGQFGLFSQGWNQSLQGPLYGSPAVSSGEVLIGDAIGNVYAFDGATGNLIWRVGTSGSDVASLAVGQGMVYAMSSAGLLTAIGISPTLDTLSVPATVSSGATVTATVHVEGVNATGAPGPALSGATVALSVCSGTLNRTTAISDSYGNVDFGWTAPSGASTSIDCLLTATVTATGYASTTVQANSTVLPASGGTVLPTVSVAPAQSLLPQGGSTSVSVDVTSTGLPVAGASVVLTTSPVLGSVSPSQGTTGTGGTVSFTYTAPPSVSASTPVLLIASASTSSGTGSASAALVVVPLTVSSSLSVSVSASPSNVAPGGAASVAVRVTNVSSGAPIAGAGVAVGASPASAGTLSASAGTSDVHGWWNLTFTAASTSTSVPLLLTATATGPSGTAESSTSLSVVPLQVSFALVAPSSPLTVSTGTSVGIELSSGGTPVPAGIQVSASLGPSGAGTLNSSTSLTEVGGVAWFTVKPSAGVSTVDLQVSAGGGNGPYAASGASYLLPVVSSSSTSGGSGSSGSSGPSHYFPWDVLAAVALLAVALLVFLLAGRRRSGPANGVKDVSDAGASKSGPSAKYVPDPTEEPPADAAPGPESASGKGTSPSRGAEEAPAAAPAGAHEASPSSEADNGESSEVSVAEPEPTSGEWSESASPSP